jgi:diacylglycerol kinase family enzyme
MPDARVGPETPFCIVFNAASGSGDAERARVEIEQVLDEAGRPYELFPIEHSGQIADTARRAVDAALEHRGAIIAAGGDGTVNAAIEATLPTGLPFGIVPQGTFNYSARAHGIPLETAAATRSLLDARIKPVQVGMVNDRAFFVNASLGLYPQILQDRELYKRQYGRRRAIAFWAGLVTLFRHRVQLTLEIEHDQDREIVRTPTLFVGNNSLQLEQIGLSEAYDVQQWRLVAVMVKPVSTMTLIWLVARGALGQLGDEERVVDFAFRRMSVKSISSRQRKVKVARDGEICWLQPPISFSVAPRALNLMVPASSTASE